MALTCRVEEPSTASISDMLQSLHTIGMYLRSRRYCRPGFRNRDPVYRGAFVSPISISSRQQIEFQGIPRALLAFDGERAEFCILVDDLPKFQIFRVAPPIFDLLHIIPDHHDNALGRRALNLRN
jgi:hypothetical protein